MNAVATTLARRIPLLGGLLLFASGFGLLLLFSGLRVPLDGVFAALLLILSVFCMMRQRAIEEPGRCRVIAIFAVLLGLFGQFLRMASLGPGTPFIPSWAVGILASYAFFLGAVGMLGGTLGLRDDPDNEAALRLRRSAATVTFTGFGLFLISELMRLYSYGAGFATITAGASVFTLFVVLIRGCLAIAAVLICRRTPEGDAVFRREAVIFKTLVASIGFNVLSWIAFVVVVLFQLMPGLHDAGRYLWLGAVYLLLTLVCIALIPVALQKPPVGYNSASGSNSSGGAEA